MGGGLEKLEGDIAFFTRKFMKMIHNDTLYVI